MGAQCPPGTRFLSPGLLGAALLGRQIWVSWPPPIRLSWARAGFPPLPSHPSWRQVLLICTRRGEASCRAELTGSAVQEAAPCTPPLRSLAAGSLTLWMLARCPQCRSWAEKDSRDTATPLLATAGVQSSVSPSSVPALASVASSLGSSPGRAPHTQTWAAVPPPSSLASALGLLHTIMTASPPQADLTPPCVCAVLDAYINPPLSQPEAAAGPEPVTAL